MNIEGKRINHHSKSSPKRVLYLSSAGDIAGSEVALLHFLLHLDRRKYSPFVVCCQAGKFPARLGEAGIPHVIIPLVISLKRFFLPSSVVLNMKSLCHIHRLLNDTSVDIVQTIDTMVFKILFVPLLFSRKPILCHLVNYEWKRLWMIRRLFRKPRSHGIAVSQAVLDHYRSVVGISERKMSVVYLSTDAALTRSSTRNGSLKRELNLRQKDRLIGLIARFDVWKGHLTLLKAVERIIEQIPNVHVVIAGDVLNAETFPFLVEYKAKVLHYASRLVLQGRVHFLGWQDDIERVLQSLDIVVSASEHEPFGLNIMEAMAHGIPVVGSDSGGTPELIRHEENGLLFRTGDDADLARCLIRLLNNRPFARNLAENGKKTVIHGFTHKHHTKHIERLYDRILA